MVALANYPNKSQLQAHHNPAFDCVPTSMADGLTYLTGRDYSPDEVLLGAYPPDWTGGTAAAVYIPYCAKQGVKLFAINGDGSVLVQAVHEQIQQLHPVLITEPDVYAPSHPDWSHVLSMYQEDNGSLTARDPYSTHDVTHTDEQWAKLFEFHQVWAMELENDMSITINSPHVSTYFTQQADGSWLCHSTGKSLRAGMLGYYTRMAGLSTLGLPITNELAVESLGIPEVNGQAVPGALSPFAHLAGHSVTVQFMERGALIYDPQHIVDNPPGAGDVYPLHVYSTSPGTDPRLFSLQHEVAQLSAQLQAEQQKVAPADPVLATAASKYADIVKIVQG